jgi:hypothetical protein
MSVDFPDEAARCQRFLSVTPQISFDPDEMTDAIGGLNYSRRHCLIEIPHRRWLPLFRNVPFVGRY